MYDDRPDILASRLNFDVIAFRGNTRQEMMAVGIISLAITIFILGIITKLLFNMFLIGVGLSFPASIPAGWLIATILQKLKAGKPKGYVKQSLLLWLDKQRLKKSPFITYSGCWSVRRHRR